MKLVVLIFVVFISACTTNTTQGTKKASSEGVGEFREAMLNLSNASSVAGDLDLKPFKNVVKGGRSKPYFNCGLADSSQSGASSAIIDVEFEEMDLSDALIEISLLADTPIMTDDSIEGIVSGKFEGQTVTEILGSLLSIGEFDFKISPFHIFIGSTDPSASSYHQLSKTCIYRPNYLDALSLVTLLPEFYQRFIKINKKNGFVAVTAANSMMRRIQHDLILFDLPQKQLVMELSIVEISTEALEVLGLDWKNIKNKASLVYNQSLGAASYGGRSVAIPTMKANQFLDAVNALKRTGHAEVKTMPTIVVLEGKEAKFSSKQTVWSNEVMATSHKKEAVEFGVEMNVVPYVSERDHIQLDIKGASVSDFIIDSYGLPRLVKHSMSSSVSIRNNESLIIGGLLQKKIRRESSGVPILEGIPFVGGIFSSSIYKKIESEILIILQPRIIQG